MANGVGGLTTNTVAYIQNQNKNVKQSTNDLAQVQTNLATTQDQAVVLQAGAEGGEVAEGDIEALIQQKEQIEAVIEQLTQEAKDLENQIEKETKELQNLTKQYEAEVKNLEGLQEDFDRKQNALANLNEEIAYTQGVEQRRFEGKISDITTAALNEYDPEKHGDDFNAYLNEQMGSAGLSTFSALDFLNSDAQKLAGETNSLLEEVKSKATTVKNLSGQISTQKDYINSLQDSLNTKNTEIESQNAILKTVTTQINKITGAGLTGAEVLSQLSDAEKKLAIDNNIDLTQTFEDGSPKYVVARGQDDKYHIYEMDGPNSCSATSLARKYGTQGGGLRGSDIVPSGSGYMRGIESVGETSGRAVYSFSCINSDLTDGEASSCQKCYTTCSPLSFDVDGDGVHTSSEQIRYDIDGDGILDTVNNSAEWVLAFDKDGNGIAGENGSELFGDNTDLDGDGKKDGYKNGFDALKALAQKEGLVGPNGGVLDAKGLKFLEEKYGLVMTKGYGGEAKSLSDLGITEINLSTSDTKLTKNFDGQHNDIMRQEGATFKVNGQTREYADIWNAKLDQPQMKTNKANVQAPADSQTASAISFDINAIDLESAMEFLNKADSSEAVQALTKEVDYGNIIQGGKLSAKLEHNMKEKFAEATEEVQEKVQEQAKEKAEDQDDDFINFQKKKIK